MRRRPIVPHRTGNDRGFALVLVLWIAGILAVMASSLSDSVRTEVSSTAEISGIRSRTGKSPLS